MDSLFELLGEIFEPPTNEIHTVIDVDFEEVGTSYPTTP